VISVEKELLGDGGELTGMMMGIGGCDDTEGKD
jgi:hypothetical protein